MPDPFNHHFYEFGKWAPDEPEYGDSGLSSALGVVYSSGIYQPLRTPSQVNTGTVGIAPVRGCRSFPSLAGVNPIFYGSAANVSYFNAAAAGADLGGVVPAGATHWSFTRFGNNVLCADVLNPLKVSASLGVLANAITSVLKPRMRYIATIKTFLFGAYVDDGAAGAFNPSKFWWSAANSVVDWQPGSNRAGFGEVRKDVGPISGVVGFEDFGVLFCEFGVYRIDFVGGDNVWSLRQIGTANQGLSAKDEDSIATFGTDIYYWSRGGPNVVVGGETVAPVGGGSVRRYLTEQPWVAPGTSSVIGAADSERPIIAWSYGAKGIGIAYNAAEDAWSTFVPPQQSGSLAGASAVLIGMVTAPDRLTATSFPMDGIDFILSRLVIGSDTPAHWRYNSATTTMAASLATKIWLPYSSKRSTIHSLRVLYRARELSAGGLATVTPTLALERDSDPLFASAGSSSPTQAMVDANGYITGDGAGLPAESQAWRATLTIPSFSGMVATLAGIDFVNSPASSIT